MNRGIGVHRSCFLWLVVLVLSSGCTVRYVADYDEGVLQEIIDISKKVDLFYGRLLEIDSAKRVYENVATQYLEIETDLRSLHLRNQIRETNEATSRQIEIALELWTQDKAKHKKDNGVSDFIIKRHRNEFTRIFIAMARGEAAKNMASGTSE